ncbi:nucleotide disphospho-sugar-binding domain-containing protein [Streptomyces erythrochromogenes]|uniref:nucleotide disphospho-sugar-binding domain-containing protein n=1 Tax=Streptomyces erythrochromogenes TaxID=285574 RepID=UPI0036CDC110
MRVLFVNSPGLGHIFPSVPLAHALTAAGHDVLFAQGGDVGAVAAAGVNVVDVTPGLDYATVFRPEEIDFSVDGGDEFVAALFARVSGVTVDRLLEVARGWSPDLVVHSPLQGAGPLVAGALGVPAVSVVTGPADSAPLIAGLMRDHMKEHYVRHDVAPVPAPGLRLNSIPPSLLELLPERVRAQDDVPLRYVPFNGNGELPGWLLEPPRRPRIAVTLGSIAGLWGGLAVLAPLVAAAAGTDAEFVVTLGGGDPSLLGELPPNVRTVDWLALGPLLRTCHGLIHHGGSGTSAVAMAMGVPQCVMPLSPDQKDNERAVVERGIAIGASAGAVGTAEFRALLEDEGMRAAAAEVRDEAAAMPSPAALVGRLESLV